MRRLFSADRSGSEDREVGSNLCLICDSGVIIFKITGKVKAAEG